MGNRMTPAAARGSCWRRVALLNSCFDQCTALSGRKVLALANGENFFGQVRIFHNGAEPARVIFLMQVMQPGRIVNALGELYEDHEILCPQIELPCRAAEVKARVRAQLTFHICAHAAGVRHVVAQCETAPEKLSRAWPTVQPGPVQAFVRQAEETASRAFR